MTNPDYGQSFMGIMVRSLKQIMSDPRCGQPSLGIHRTIQYSLIDKTSTFMDTCPQTWVQFSSVPEDELFLDQVVGKKEYDLDEEFQDNGRKRQMGRKEGDCQAADGGCADDQQYVLDELTHRISAAAEDPVSVQQEIDHTGTRSGCIGGDHDRAVQRDQQSEHPVVHDKGQNGGHPVFKERRF